MAAYESNKIYFAIEWLVAGLTAFYMFRLYYGVFWGKEQSYEHTPHESPKTMLIPLIILAVGSVFTGFIPFSELVTSDGKVFETHIHWDIAIASIAVAIVGITMATVMYKKESEVATRISNAIGVFYTAAYQKFYVDELYFFITKKIIFNLISKPIAWFDRTIVDGTVNMVALVTNLVSALIRDMQSGQLQHYAMVFVFGVVALGFAFLYLIN